MALYILKFEHGNAFLTHFKVLYTLYICVEKVEFYFVLSCRFDEESFVFYVCYAFHKDCTKSVTKENLRWYFQLLSSHDLISLVVHCTTFLVATTLLCSSLSNNVMISVINPPLLLESKLNISKLESKLIGGRLKTCIYIYIYI